MTKLLVQTNQYHEAELGAALKTVMGEHGFSESPDFPARVNDRLRVVGVIAENNNSHIPKSAQADASRLLAQAYKSKSRSSRLIWLRRAADRVTSAAEPYSACSQGCSHCCHIPVSITAAEAHEIGRLIGVPPAQSPTPKVQEKRI